MLKDYTTVKSKCKDKKTKKLTLFVKYFSKNLPNFINFALNTIDFMLFIGYNFIRTKKGMIKC